MSFSSAARRLSGLAARSLGWRPAEFWAATPDELEAALSGGDGLEAEGPSRDEVAALMALHPDNEGTDDGR